MHHRRIPHGAQEAKVLARHPRPKAPRKYFSIDDPTLAMHNGNVATDQSSARLVETHSAVVVFYGDRAYKVKKPVDLGFLDFRSLESREQACRRELELNRRLSPDVYLGVAEMRGPDNESCEFMVVMRRLEDGCRLSECLLRHEDVTDALRSVAKQIASLHAANPTDPAFAHVATRDAVRGLWLQGLDQMGSLAAKIVDPNLHKHIRLLALAFLSGRERLFANRIAQGHIREGHGDLQTQDIFVLPDGPRILDCLDFDDELRWADVVADVGFLAMDLERLGHLDSATQFLGFYRDYSNERWPPALEHHYIALRAHIRAKVAALRAIQTGEVTPDIEQLQRLCAAHLVAAQPRLVIVGGSPGTGKSTLAKHLGEHIDAVVVRTDEVRQQLNFDEAQRYQPQAIDKVYEVALHQARVLLEAGEHVIVDATWSHAQHRLQAQALAENTTSTFAELRCIAAPSVCAARIVQRQSGGFDASEATPEIASAIADEFDPWPTATSISTEAPFEDSLPIAVRACGFDIA